MHKIVRYVVIAAVMLLGLIALVAAQNIQSNVPGDNGSDGQATNPSPQVIGGDEAGLRALLSRIVSSSGFPPDQSAAYVRQLPDNLPFNLPLPDKANIVGSVFYGSPGYTQVILDAQQTPDEIVQFFRDSLTTSDWSSLSADNSPVGGFVAQPWSQAFFCYQTTQAMLRVLAEGGDSATNVSITITAPADTTACGGAGAGASPGEPFTLLPQLQVPAGVSLLPSGTGGGGLGSAGKYTSLLTALTSDLPLSKIADAYNEQLKALGWQPISQEANAKMNWSGWTVLDADGKTWAGTFMVSANPAVTGRYSAQVIIEEIPAQP
ncbi:MAG: hypothetical protein ABI690_15415 [Chloroflexota bacterium]